MPEQKETPGKAVPSGAQEVFLTQEGYERLKAELEHLRTVGRAEVADLIGKAKEIGDITDSAQYESAKNDQAFLEGRIRALESQLGNAVIISPEAAGGVAGLGSRVTFTDGGVEETYTLVHPAEASSAQGRISVNAPVGKALLGQKPGDVVSVETPSGILQFTVVKVE